MDRGGKLLYEIYADQNRTLVKLQDLPDTPAINNMVAVRDELIAYVKDLNDSNNLLEEINNYEQFTKILVENDGSLNRVAALTDRVADVEVESDGTTVKSSLFGEAAVVILPRLRTRCHDTP